MPMRRRIWKWLAAAFSFVVGFILVLSDTGSGWFLIVLGMSCLGASTRAGQDWAESNPGLARWGLAGGALVVVLLAVVVGAIFLLI